MDTVALRCAKVRRRFAEEADIPNALENVGTAIGSAGAGRGPLQTGWHVDGEGIIGQEEQIGSYCYRSAR